MAQLPGHRLPLKDQGADLDEVLVALHALVVPEMNDNDSFGHSLWHKNVNQNGQRFF